MSAAEIRAIQSPACQRAGESDEVCRRERRFVDSGIFQAGMADGEAGRFADMENVLSGCKPPPRAAK